MGGCTESKQNKQQQEDPLPLFNMLIVGFTGSGKSTILSQLKGQSQVSCNQELGIDSFIINKKVKIIIFEVAGRGSISWYHYYNTSNIVLFVVDCMQSQNYAKIEQVLKQMDEQLSQNAKIIIVFNKIDLLIANNISAPLNQQTSHMTQHLDRNSDKVKNIDTLNIKDLKHEVHTCKVSGKDKIGVNNLIRKIYSLAYHQLYTNQQNIAKTEQNQVK